MQQRNGSGTVKGESLPWTNFGNDSGTPIHVQSQSLFDLDFGMPVSPDFVVPFRASKSQKDIAIKIINGSWHSLANYSSLPGLVHRFDCFEHPNLLDVKQISDYAPLQLLYNVVQKSPKRGEKAGMTNESHAFVQSPRTAGSTQNYPINHALRAASSSSDPS
jgi:hypothetical protein